MWSLTETYFAYKSLEKLKYSISPLKIVIFVPVFKQSNRNILKYQRLIKKYNL